MIFFKLRYSFTTASCKCPLQLVGLALLRATQVMKRRAQETARME